MNGDRNSLLLDCGFIIYIFCHKISHAVLPEWKGKIKALWLNSSSWAFLIFLNSKDISSRFSWLFTWWLWWEMPSLWLSSHWTRASTFPCICFSWTCLWWKWVSVQSSCLKCWWSSPMKKLGSLLQAVFNRCISFFFLVGLNVFFWEQWLMTDLLQSAILWATQWLWTEGFSWN